MTTPKTETSKMDWNFSFFYDTYAHDLLNLLKYISVS